MYRIAKSIDVDFSHHVRGHAGACINVHGHTWKLEVCLEAPELDAEGFVVDFKRLKNQVLKPCHGLLDHSLAVGEETYAEIEPSLVLMGEQLIGSRQAVHGEPMPTTPDNAGIDVGGAENRYPGGMKVAVFPFSPTSERLARWLWELAQARLADGRVSVAWARVYETLHPVVAVAEYAPVTKG